jgi:hypothetical protein
MNSIQAFVDGVATPVTATVDPLFAKLTPEHRASVWALEDAMRTIDSSRNVVKACKAVANAMIHERGYSASMLRKKYYAWVAGGRSWTTLVNKSKAPERVKALPREAVEQIYKAYCERNQRCSKRAWHNFMCDLRLGKVFKGLGDWRDLWRMCYIGERVPEKCPTDWTPPGMTYRNLQRYASLTPFEIKATRIGMKAASMMVPSIYSTRVGLLPGQVYQFDDMWHDMELVMPGESKQLVRPLEFACVDVASTYKIAYGLKPQIRDEETGKRENLKEIEMLWHVCHILTEVGFHQSGSVWCVEHGTAAIRDPIRRAIDKLTGGLIQYRDSDILGESVHKGMWNGSGKGNFRSKALVEASHRLLHYAAASLPGQTGGSAREDRPEGLDGLEAYEEKMLKAMETLDPRLVERIAHGGLSWSGYGRVIDTIYRQIYSRTDHKIEGWEQNDWVEAEWSMDGRGDWRSTRDIPMLPAHIQQAALEAARTPGFTRMRRLSPVEVWQQYQHVLARIPLWSIVDILGMDNAKRVTVRQNMTIEFQNRRFSPDPIRYLGVVTTPDGHTMQLSPEREYALFVTPYNLAKAVIADRFTGQVLGIADRWAATNPLDTITVHAMQEHQARVKAALVAPIQERHQEEADDRLAAIAHNEMILEEGSGCPAPRKQRKQKQRSGRDLVLDMASRAQPTTGVNHEQSNDNEGWD